MTFVPTVPLEQLSVDQIMVLTMIRVMPSMKVAYCLTGDHFGVTCFREPRCPMCG